MLFWNQRFYPQPLHASPVRCEHFDLDSAVLDFLSLRRQSSE
jgi:hypothetical protein